MHGFKRSQASPRPCRWTRSRWARSRRPRAGGERDPCGDGSRPGALPAQALDHATGDLAAAAALTGLVERPGRGGSVRDLALARTATWLQDAAPPAWACRVAAALPGRRSGALVSVRAMVVRDAPVVSHVEHS